MYPIGKSVLLIAFLLSTIQVSTKAQVKDSALYRPLLVLNTGGAVLLVDNYRFNPIPKEGLSAELVYALDSFLFPEPINVVEPDAYTSQIDSRQKPQEVTKAVGFSPQYQGKFVLIDPKLLPRDPDWLALKAEASGLAGLIFIEDEVDALKRPVSRKGKEWVQRLKIPCFSISRMHALELVNQLPSQMMIPDIRFKESKLEGAEGREEIALKEKEALTIGYAPNPFNDFLQFEINSGQEQSAIKLTIFNSNGMQVYALTVDPTLHQLRISTNDWPAGLYTATFIRSGIQKNITLVKAD